MEAQHERLEPLEGTVRRLHPSSVALHLLGSLKRWIVPLALVLIFSKGARWELWFMLWIVPSTAYQTLRYFTVRWSLCAGELLVRDGVLFRNERHVPFERIQNLDLVQGPLERLLAVAKVRVETASGSEPEAVLEVLSLRDVELLRARVFAGRPARAAHAAAAEAPVESASADSDTDETTRPLEAGAVALARLSARELLLLGFSTQRGFALIFALLVFARELDLFEGLGRERLRSLLGTVPEPRLVAAAALVVLVAFGLAGCLSIAWAVLRFHGFELSRAGEDLRWRAGLLTRHFATIPRPRIQLVSVQAGPLQRLLGAVSVRVETAGGTEQEGETGQARRWFVPWLARVRLPALLAEIDPSLGGAALEWQPPAPGFRRRMVVRAVVAGALLGLAGLSFSRPWGAVALWSVLVPALVALELVEARHIAWARTPRGLAFQSGALRRKQSFVRAARLQCVAVRESPFDRRHRMATLSVDTAGAGPAGHKLEVPYLRKDVAASLAAELSAAAEAHGFEW